MTIDRDSQHAYSNSLKKADEVLDVYLDREPPSKTLLMSALLQQQKQPKDNADVAFVCDIERADVRKGMKLLCTINYSSLNRAQVANSVNSFLFSHTYTKNEVRQDDETSSLSFAVVDGSEDLEVMQIKAINAMSAFRKSIMDQVEEEEREKGSENEDEEDVEAF